MRAVIALILFLALGNIAEAAAAGRVIKVLPHLLDLKGRHALTPSLYDRDAYQAYLREHPEEQSGVRFDVEWSAKGVSPEPLKLRLEVRGVVRRDLPEQLVLEKTLRPGRWNRWSGLLVTGEDFHTLGRVTAWRVSLWDGADLLAEQKSFLW